MTWATRYIGKRDLSCWDLVRLVFKDRVKIILPAYGEIDHKQLDEVEQAVSDGRTANDVWLPVIPFPGGEKPLDVVVMSGWLKDANGHTRRGIVHTGVVTQPGFVLHTDLGDEVVEVPLRHPMVKRRIVAAYRHRETI